VNERPIEIETHAHPTFSVIWMHGLGADGSDFVPLVPELGLPSSAAVRFIFPHARKMPVTWNGGYIMRAWYDIVSIEDERRHADVPGVLESRRIIRELIAGENARGVPTNRIVLAGFSQGGAIAYTVGTTHPEPLAGIIALSTYVPAPELLLDEVSTANLDTPIFAAHGTADSVVPLSLGEKARDLLQEQGFKPEWHTYPMGHSVCQEEIAALGQWLTDRLAD
jgi:phospholipase/carboxylesterase